MIYFLIFVLSFLLGTWIKINGETIRLESENYTIVINLYFIIIACVIVLFFLIITLNFFSYISSIFVNINHRRKKREEMLAFENVLSMDLDYCQNNSNDKTQIVKIFNSGKSGNYSFFTCNLIQLSKKSHNLSLLISYKLINYLRKNRILFKNFIEYCSSSISDKLLSLPFQVEYAILQGDWCSAIVKLKEATKLNILLPFDCKEMFTVFYCGLAREYEKIGNFKEAIKSVCKAQTTFQPINYLKAEFYIKLGQTKKASAILEIEYTANPTPQVAKLYFDLNNQNAEKLYNLRQDYYFSYCILALSAINSGKYDLADQYLNTALTKANYLSIYLIMIQLKTISQNSEHVIYWLNHLYSHALPDPCWKCKHCNETMNQWECKCAYCGEFNSIVLSK
ncbi:heme biosynthesis protein HemY [Wolbachia pipientis]|uniref:Heme biosynthesis protein HemY n=1 Tax=Wolbachia pipientis TaxID=955 RepID=A0A1E7QJH8_WOLPI|nr:hypothetical protein [Wolbachia pipientis]OEY86620.1 heme biosynthesis protein HemY [Wolbachia pipientis]